jgi:hypothetical protein
MERRLFRNVKIREENSIAALEVMSRFATHPARASTAGPRKSRWNGAWFWLRAATI